MLTRYGITLPVILLLLATVIESIDESSSSAESSPEVIHKSEGERGDVSALKTGERPNTKKPLMNFDLDVSSPPENVTLDENGEAIPGQKHKKHHLHFEMAKKANKPEKQVTLPLNNEKSHVQHQKDIVRKDDSKVIHPQVVHPKDSHSKTRAEKDNLKEYFINAKKSTINEEEGEKGSQVSSSERHGQPGYHFVNDYSAEPKFFDANHGRIVIDPQRDSIVACVDYLPQDTCKVLKPLCARSDTARAIRYLRERSDYIMYLSNDLQKHLSYVENTVNDPGQEQLLRNLQEISQLLPSVKKTAPLIRLILDEDSEDELESLINAHLQYKQECAAHQKMCYKTHIPIYKRQKACALYDDICCCGDYKFQRYYQNLGNMDPLIESKEAKAMRRATRRFVEASCAATCVSCPTRYRIKEYAEDVRRAFDCDQKKIPVGHDLRVHFEEDPFNPPAKHHVTIQRERSSESDEDIIVLPSSYPKPPRDCPRCGKHENSGYNSGPPIHVSPAHSPSYNSPNNPSYVPPAQSHSYNPPSFKPGYGPAAQHPIYS